MSKRDGSSDRSGDTTSLLQSTEVISEKRTVWAIRWLTPGATTEYSVLDKNRVSLGRGSGCDIELSASGVSREHAVLSRQGPVYSLADAGSTNGTYVNGERVRHVALDPNDVLRFGQMLGVLVRTSRAVGAEGYEDTLTLGGALFGPGLARQLDELRKVATTLIPVVLVGETGVGKEVVSRALHQLSGREGPFHAVNCAALPAALAEAELFGYRRGAFTGAEQAAVGHLRAAHGGTLLLDELADLTAPIQAKLLRALQEAEVTPLGETRATPVDVRMVAAVQQPLASLVEAGRLRADLAMRLNGISLQLSPLRERRIDIALLVRHLTKRFSQLSTCRFEARALEQLLLHAWPGNVRELEHLLRKVLALHPDEPLLRRTMLPDDLGRERTPAPAVTPEQARKSRAEHDFERLVAALRVNGGQLSGAAQAAGISRQRAYRLLAGRSVEEVLRETPDHEHGQKK